MSITSYLFGLGKAALIALTAFAHQFDARKAMAAGFQVHLSKPVEMHNLIATLAGFKPADGPKP